MTAFSERLVRHLCEPAWHEEILGDLEERRHPARSPMEYAWDVASVVLRRSRLRNPAVRLRFLLASAFLATAAVALVARPGPMPAPYTISAHDDAGTFTLELSGRRVRAATLDGRLLPEDRVTQSGGVVRILGADRGSDLIIRLTRNGGIEWDGRQP